MAPILIDNGKSRNREIATIATIAAIMILIPVIYFPLAQAQGAIAVPKGTILPPLHEPPDKIIVHYHVVGQPAGLNTTGSNVTGAAGNTTAETIPITHPAGAPTHSCPSRTGLCY